VQHAFDAHSEQGTDCRNFVITGLRRNETETLCCNAWGVASEAAEAAWVSIATRPHRRVLLRSKRLAGRQRPRRIPHAALAVALREITAAHARPAVGAANQLPLEGLFEVGEGLAPAFPRLRCTPAVLHPFYRPFAVPIRGVSLATFKVVSGLTGTPRGRRAPCLAADGPLSGAADSPPSCATARRS